MSKIYNEYLRLKAKDPNKLYLFKSGKFYIFVGDDVDTINNYVVLKRTNFSNESQKCGFPESVLDDYLRVFKNHHLDIEVITEIIPINDDDSKLEKITNYLKRIKIDKITPLEAFKHLVRIKEIVDDEERS